MSVNKPKLDEFMTGGGLELFSIRYWSPEVEAMFTLDDEQMDDPSLQIVYTRSYKINGKQFDEKYWLYFAPDDAIAIGSALLAWGNANKETDT